MTSSSLWRYVNLAAPGVLDAMQNSEEAARARSAPRVDDSDVVAAQIEDLLPGCPPEYPFPIVRIGDGSQFDRVVGAYEVPTSAPGDWYTRLSWTAVYEYFNEDGALLYVGLTGNIEERTQRHADGAPFYPYVKLLRWRHYPLRYMAAEIEWKLIQKHRPPFNGHVGFNGQPDWNNNETLLTTKWGTQPHPVDLLIKQRDKPPQLRDLHAETASCWWCASGKQLNNLLNGRNVAAFEKSTWEMCPQRQEFEVPA